MHGVKRKGVAFAFGCFLVWMAGEQRAAAGGQGAVTGSAAALAIEATPASVKFENVPVGQLYTQPVRISNTTSRTITLTTVSASSPEFAITGVTVPVQLEAGANVMFNVAYKPKRAKNVAGKIVVTTDAGASLELDVRASAQSRELGLWANESSVDFGMVAVGKKETKEVTLQNDGNSEVTISKVSVRGENFSAAGGEGLRLSPGQSATVQLEFGPQGNGSRTGTVDIFSSARRAPIEIAVSGAGAVMSGHSVVLKWEQSLTGVAGYNIYRSSDQGGSFAKLEASPVAGISYTDTGLAAGQTYVYMIRAVDGNNVESEDSERITVSVPEG